MFVKESGSLYFFAEFMRLGPEAGCLDTLQKRKVGCHLAFLLIVFSHGSGGWQGRPLGVAGGSRKLHPIEGLSSSYGPW